MNLKQANTNGIEEQYKAITVQQNGKEVRLITATVGDFECNNTSIQNLNDFQNWVIAKVTLEPKDATQKKAYLDTINKAENKKTNLYLAIDAESADNNWAEVLYDEVFNATPNVWLKEEGKQFGLGSVREYKKGDKGEVVQEINIKLTGFGKGLLPLSEFTSETEKAVSKFQKDYMKVEPTGIANFKTLKSIDEFCEKYKQKISDYECPCTNSFITERPDEDKRCSGFGKKQFKEKYKSASKTEKNYKYEYPGIHRSLLWGISAIEFYMKDTDYKIKSIYRGYRCWADNLHNPNHTIRTSTNHMGKAADLHFLKNGKRTKEVSDIEYIREHFFSKYLGAPESGAGQTHGFGWKKGKFGLEPKKFNNGSSGATTWIHVDLREIGKTNLEDKFFIKEQNEIIGKNLIDE